MSKVTIAIPAYKSTFLNEAIDSALNQDYQDIELIIVNDKSPNNLDEIINKYNDSRIRYYINEENLGKKSICLNWNKCLEYATGEYFVLLCDDDILFPNFVSTLLELAKRYPYCNVFHGRKVNKHDDGTLEDSPEWPEFEDGNSFANNNFAKKRLHTVTEFMLRTNYIKKQGGYLIYPAGFYSDTASILLWAQNGGIASSKLPLCMFRFSDEHISSNANPIYNFGKFQAALQYWEWAKGIPHHDEHINEIREDVESTFFNAFIGVSWCNRLMMLYNIPNEAVCIKHKLGFLLRAIKE